MNLKVVSNSTPIIALSKIGLLDILRELFSTIVIPEAVRVEVSDRGKNRAGSAEIKVCEWIVTKKVQNHTAVDFLLVSVDPGEAEAIALARESNADLLLIDDRAGRRISESVGLSITGTIGVLLRYYRGDPFSFKKSIDELIANGFRIGMAEYNNILKLAK
jgi:predicted nucleic acid-binding protein